MTTERTRRGGAGRRPAGCAASAAAPGCGGGCSRPLRTANAAGGRAADPLRADPSRTAAVRRAWAADVRRRFALVRREVRRALLADDALGLASNVSWGFLPLAARASAFKAWVGGVVDGAFAGAQSAWRRLGDLAWRRGAARSSREAGAPQQRVAGDPERRALLDQRLADGLQRTKEQLAAAVSAAVTDGLSRGLTKGQVAKDALRAAGASERRALVFAATEAVRHHAEGQLDGLASAGVREVGVLVEFAAVDDSRRCPLCNDLDGQVMPLDEARGLIPVHAACRCSFRVVREGRR